MKIYVAGPITGIENNNFEAFDKATEYLRLRGHEVINPWSEVTTPEYGSMYDKMCRADLKAMMDCDAIATLEGWENSRGARTEIAVGLLVGIPVNPLLYYHHA